MKRFFYLKERKRKKRKLHLINSHGADIYSISLRLHLYKTLSFCRHYGLCGFYFFLFILIYKKFFLFGSIFLG